MRFKYLIMEKSKLYAILTILLWSLLATLGAFTQKLPPFQVTAIALLIGSLVSIHRLKEWAVPPTTLLVGIFGIFGYHYLLFSAFRTAPAMEVNLLNYLWPLLIVILSPMFGNGTIRLPHILSAALGLSGAALIVTNGAFKLPDSFPSGYYLAIAAALTWAVYSLACKRLPHFPDAAIGCFCFASGILSLGLHLITEETVWPTQSEWFALTLMGAGPLGLAFFFWKKAMQLGDPKQIGALAYLAPLLSTLILAFSGQGTLTSNSILAGVLILSGAIGGMMVNEKR